MSSPVHLHLTPSTSQGPYMAIFNEEKNTKYALRSSCMNLGTQPTANGHDTQPEDFMFDSSNCSWKNNYVSYRIKANVNSNQMLYLDLYTNDALTSNAKQHSRGVIPVKNIDGSSGSVLFPLLDNSLCSAGWFKVDYLVILPRPIQHCNSEDAQNGVSSSKKYKEQGRPLRIGHRGCGADRSTSGRVENTLSALSKAHDSGADFVEFDVQLTGDEIPVIFHDYTAIISHHQKNGSVSHHETDLSSLTHAQWRASKIAFNDSDPASTNDALTSADPKLCPFPTLEEAFTTLHPNLGFLIEVKYPMQEETGKWESKHRVDKNLLVDRVLDVVERHAGNRRVRFCCFDPQVCILLRQKQSLFDVLFNCYVESNVYTPMMLKVTQTFDLAKRFSVAEGLAGISCLVDGVLDRLPSVIDEAHQAGLMLSTWGDTNTNADVLKKQIVAGIDAVIYDDIDVLKLPAIA